ncbi:MAG: hypothetical protein GAK31_03421 [Stenotrophomonas maltophilia]|uniref:Pectate lyase superfamily protein domain-containing protein n=1 Tax=Stenotrophomonas maltophilia TaxID=40324 RepID=A0A7V8FDK8_STEMA|nr:MAG: hypothetical protein GAK31_03421 [Stenotrophomonas maltophilia]
MTVSDFSFAGYRSGQPDLPLATGTVIDVRDFGMVADDDRDDSHALLRALTAAHAVDGPVVVQLPPGRIVLNEVLRITRGNIVLRGHGSGAGGTELYMPRPLRMVDRSSALDELRQYLRDNHKHQVEPARNVDVLFSPWSWSGGFLWVGPQGNRPAAYLAAHDTPSRRDRLAEVQQASRGHTQLRVADAARLRVGDVVRVRWFNRQGPDGALVQELYGPQYKTLKVGSHHWTTPDRPLVVQANTITAIDGTTVTLAAPLMHDAGGPLQADLARWQPLQKVGIEELALVFAPGGSFGNHQEEGYNGIYFTGVYNGWVRNVRTRDADAGVLTYDSANLTLADISVEGARPAHNAVHLGNVQATLVRDLEVHNTVIHTLSVNTQASGNVFLRAQAWQAPVIDQHAGANHQNLFDQVTFHVQAQRDAQGKAWYPVWNGCGAGYWEPGHGRYNTTWNLRVLVEGGAAVDESVRLAGEDEGPDARLVGLSGNRPFSVDYRPAAAVRAVGQRLWQTPSLYELQRAQRVAGQPVATCLAP